jgi:hypothetical protein
MGRYDFNVFLNVPFDRKYRRLSDALVFAVHDCGFIARSASEIEDSGQARVEKILDIIEQSKFGIHDISRAGVDPDTKLARFNMPLELGLFLGAKRYGSSRDREKRCLVLDRDRYRYRNFCSDIAGQDVRAHGDDPSEAIRAVRDWLNTYRAGMLIPGGKMISERYERFRVQLPAQARDLKLDHRELTFGDYTHVVVGWLRKTPW